MQGSLRVSQTSSCVTGRISRRKNTRVSFKEKEKKKKNNKKVGETILVFGLKVLLWLLDTSSRLDLIGDKDFV